MKRYCWFHPEYILEEGEQSKTIQGQRDNFQANNYIILQAHELSQVSPADHLTIIGHSTPPKAIDENDADTGRYIQGDNAEQCVARLIHLGLRFAPKLLSLECCKAAIAGGIAQQLSRHPFFKYSLIEASAAPVGRNPGMSWCLREDRYGRVLSGRNKIWTFLLSGYSIAECQHDTYNLTDVLESISPKKFHSTFFSHYQPGCFGGRIGRYCRSNKKDISLDQALFFAKENMTSATKDAFDLTLHELFEPKPK